MQLPHRLLIHSLSNMPRVQLASSLHSPASSEKYKSRFTLSVGYFLRPSKAFISSADSSPLGILNLLLRPFLFPTLLYHLISGMALSFEAFESPRKQPEVPRKNVSVPIHNGPTVPSFTTSNISSLLDERQPDFTPTLRFYLAFATLAVITLMVALDGTSLSVALPVN